MKEKIKKIFNLDNLPFIIFFIVLIFIHININTMVSDDKIFFKILENGKNLFTYINERYNRWSSRIIIETVLLVIIKYKFIIWKILNIGICLLLAKSISKICQTKNNKIINYMICVSILLIPISALNNTGWISTTMNYLWVISLGTYALSIIKDFIDNKKIQIWKYPLYIVSTLFACNQEQMVSVMFLILGIFLLYEIKTKSIKHVLKNEKLLIIQFIITILSLIFILNCPGNMQRGAIEVRRWYPEYKIFSIVEKVELGLTSTMKQLILNTNYIFIGFTAVLFIGTCKNTKNKAYKAIAIIPILSSVVFNIFRDYSVIIINNLESVINLFSQDILIMPISEISLPSTIMILTYILILAIIPICMYFIFKNTHKFYICMRNIFKWINHKIYYGIFSNYIWFWRKNIYIYVCEFYNMYIFNFR